jgi:integrase
MGKKKQKGYGTGTVYPRKNKDGKIIGYRGSYFTPDGKRRYVSAKRKGDAEKSLRQAMADADRGLTFDAGTLILGNYLDMWLANTRATVRQRTWERYEQIVRVHLQPELGRLKLKGLTSTHVRSLYQEKLQSRSPRTVEYIHTTLRKALKDAVSDTLIPRNATDGIKAPKTKKKEINPLNPEQTRTFLGAVRGDRLEALYVLAVHRGLRQGELLGLRWEDVDLEGGTVQVRRTLSLTRDGHIFEPPKNGKGRSIELTQPTVEALKSHLTSQLKEIEALGDDYKDQGLIFPGEHGQPIRPWTLTGKFERILQRVGLPRIRFHDLRHTCATLLLSKGVHAKFVQELLGHATISITLDTYSHVIPAMGDQTRTAMEDVLS